MRFHAKLDRMIRPHIALNPPIPEITTPKILAPDTGTTVSGAVPYQADDPLNQTDDLSSYQKATHIVSFLKFLKNDTIFSAFFSCLPPVCLRKIVSKIRKSKNDTIFWRLSE